MQRLDTVRRRGWSEIVRASSYNSILNAVIVVALTHTLVLNLISQTCITTEVVKFDCAFKLGSALLNLYC